MQLHHTEGIVIQAVAFRDYDQIVTLFTPDNGLVKAILKGSNRKGRKSGGPCSPLTRIELSWTDGKGEIGRGEEFFTTHHYAALRQNLVLLEAGCDLLRAIQQSQFVGKASPDLYKLLLYYLDKLSTSPDPAVVTASFRLKLLKHEGLLSIPFHCFACQEPLKDAFYHSGAVFCAKHRPPMGILLSMDETTLMESLANCQSYSSLVKIILTPSLSKKITTFFSECLHF